MFRDEDNAGYRRLIKETLEFDPEILKRYVNFMNNPDEKAAVEQFGKGDKYFGVATLLATLPGLPMLGHGQVEGFGEKYGMEFRRATLDEQPDTWLLERHEREIFPLLHRRGWFAGAERLRPVRLRHRRWRGRRERVRLFERAGPHTLAGRLPHHRFGVDRRADPGFGRRSSVRRAGTAPSAPGPTLAPRRAGPGELRGRRGAGGVPRCRARGLEHLRTATRLPRAGPLARARSYKGGTSSGSSAGSGTGRVWRLAAPARPARRRPGGARGSRKPSASRSSNRSTRRCGPRSHRTRRADAVLDGRWSEPRGPDAIGTGTLGVVPIDRGRPAGLVVTRYGGRHRR